MTSPMRLRVNGAWQEVTAAPDRTLLSALRDDLGLYGAREGCGIGICGACTVLLAGRPVSSCLILLAQVGEREILTVEGLSSGDELHPVQQAFLDHAAFQCAYCTPGFILTTVALLNETSPPGPEKVRRVLAGNLCRCGSYLNILEAVEGLLRGGEPATGG